MDSDQQGLTIGAVAKAAGVNVETVRFYQRRALLPEPDKPYGRIRRYEAKDVARVRFVKAAQRLGFSLDEVAGLLSWTTARTVTRRDSSPKQSSATCARS
jgi:MerR family mercuric resistance operon transcriptional regulator